MTNQNNVQEIKNEIFAFLDKMLVKVGMGDLEGEQKNQARMMLATSAEKFITKSMIAKLNDMQIAEVDKMVGQGVDFEQVISYMISNIENSDQVLKEAMKNFEETIVEKMRA